MSNVNRVELSGNLTRDPELQVTQSGKSLLKFGLAVGEKNGDKTYTNFFECVIWGKYGEVMANYLSKGQKVAVAGSLHYSSWSDPKTGYTRSKVEVYVQNVDTWPPPARDPHEYASGQQMPIAAAPPQVPAADLYEDEIIPF